MVLLALTEKMKVIVFESYPSQAGLYSVAAFPGTS